MTEIADLIQTDRGQDRIAIHLVTKATCGEWLKSLSAGQRASVGAQKFEGAPGQVAIVPDGDDWFAAGGVADPEDLKSYCLAPLAEKLPA